MYPDIGEMFFFGYIVILLCFKKKYSLNECINMLILFIRNAMYNLRKNVILSVVSIGTKKYNNKSKIKLVLNFVKFGVFNLFNFKQQDIYANYNSCLNKEKKSWELLNQHKKNIYNILKVIKELQDEYKKKYFLKKPILCKYNDMLLYSLKKEWE